MTDVTLLAAALADRYAIDREIGAGGMATVYLARDLRHDRQVALKVLNPELGAVLGVERFLAEIKVTANLQHPNLLPLFDSGETSGLLFYVMPFVEGESLRAKLEREKQLPVDEALHIAVAVAGALDHAHRHGVIHRDLKPENILMQADEPVIADFGIALAVSNAGGQRITQTGLSLGTPQYMSPEQATGDRSVDGRTDLYSLGAITYEMLTGEAPHSGNTAQAIIAKLMTEEVRPISVLRKSVPANVDAAVRRALEKLPADRFSSAREFANAIQARGAMFIGAHSEILTHNARVRSPGTIRARALAAVAFMMAAIAGGGWWLAPRNAELPPTVRFALDLPVDVRLGGGSPQGQWRDFAISPDGKTLALVGNASSGVSMLWIRSLDGLVPRPLSGTETGSGPFFSPDGKWIGFFANHQIHKIAVSGGPVIPVSETLAGQWLGATWAANGQIVFATGSGLGAVSATGGKSRIITGADSVGGRLARWPHMLADGETVLFTSWTTGVNSARIGVASVGGGKSTMLDLPGTSPLGVLDGQLVYASATGALMAVPFDAGARRVTGAPVQVLEHIVVSVVGAAQAALSGNGTLMYKTGESTLQVVLADEKGSTRPLVAEPRAYSYARYSPDGRRIAMTIGNRGLSEIWVYDLASHTPTRLATEGNTNDRPEWTPDSKRVIYRSDRAAGGYSLWSQPADGSGGADLLLKVPGLDVWEGVMAPDGQSIVYRTGTIGFSVIWSRSFNGDTTPKLIANSAATQWGARISPDGRWVAYSSDESGTTETYMRQYPGVEGARIQVSTGGGDTPVWSRDGRRLYYVQGTKVMAATIVTSPTVSVAKREQILDGDFTFLGGHATYDEAPDGKQLLLLKPIGGESQTIVAYGWRAELRARLGARVPK